MQRPAATTAEDSSRGGGLGCDLGVLAGAGSEGVPQRCRSGADLTIWVSEGARGRTNLLACAEALWRASERPTMYSVSSTCVPRRSFARGSANRGMRSRRAMRAWAAPSCARNVESMQKRPVDTERCGTLQQLSRPRVAAAKIALQHGQFSPLANAVAQSHEIYDGPCRIVAANILARSCLQSGQAPRFAEVSGPSAARHAV